MRGGILVVLWAVAFTTTCAQENVPEILLRQYRTREELRSGFSYLWDVEETLAIDERVAQHLRLERTTQRRTHSEWLISTDALVTVVRGTRDRSLLSPPPAGIDTKETKIEYFGKGWGLAGDPAAYRVWACEGDCVRFRHPTERSGLDILPEDFVLLAGKDLFRLYGVSWRVVARSRERMVLQADVSEGNFAPFTVTTVLTRSANWEPAEIRIDYRRDPSHNMAWARHYKVLSYRRWRDGSLPDLVVCKENSGFDASLHRVWRLKRIEPLSAPILLPLAGGDVIDYRLLGSNLTDAQVSVNDPHVPIVYYSWQGHLPPVEHLRQIWQNQSQLAQLQEGPTASARWYRVIPPLLLILIGIIWYWRLRVRKAS
ncbi:MAG: hypothetical protein ACUVSV_04255 [Armatimonadota bacterium]